MIRKDCMMYIPEQNKCNGLIEMKCSNCKFYKPCTQDKKDKYIETMKSKGMYLCGKPKRNKTKPKKENGGKEKC